MVKFIDRRRVSFEDIMRLQTAEVMNMHLCIARFQQEIGRLARVNLFRDILRQFGAEYIVHGFKKLRNGNRLRMEWILEGSKESKTFYTEESGRGGFLLYGQAEQEKPLDVQCGSVREAVAASVQMQAGKYCDAVCLVLK